MDERVKEAQIWLNETYHGRKGFSDIEPDGRPGVAVMETLVVALQIELGISNPTGYFGDATAAAYNKHILKYGDRDSNMNLVRILQHALFCKGYNPTAVSGYFGDETLKAVKKVQTDAGFSAASLTNTLTAKVFKQILSSDALVLVAGGNSMIRKIQQAMNRDYSHLFDLIPCDGKYNAATNKALIYAFQIEGGMATNTANGNFGPMTQDIARNNVLSVGSTKQNLIRLAKYALYINGVRRRGLNVFDCSSNGSFTPVFDETMQSKVKAFQKFTGMLKTDGKVDINVWMSLLVSTGYPKRDVLACDTSTQLTATKAKRIYANDFRIVGRYLTGRTTAGPKFLTRDELNMLFSQGLSVFAIYQDETQYYNEHPTEETTVNYYNRDQGYNDAKKAVAAAEALGIPYGETIFFAVDYDFNDKQTTNMIIPHFVGINDYMRNNGNKYTIGCYGPRNICSRISKLGYAKWSFVSDMSTGYSGNKGFILPENWVFDQIREYTQGAADGGFALDCVATSGKYNGFNRVVPEGTEQDLYPIGEGDSGKTPEEVRSENNALRYGQEISDLMGLEIDIKAFDHKYTAHLPGATVEAVLSYGTEATLGSEYRKSKITITHGKIENAAFDALMNVLEDLNVDVSSGIDGTNMVDFVNKVQYSIKDGYMQFGFDVNLDGTVTASYLFHKELEITERVATFTELAITIKFEKKMEPSQVEQFFEQKEQAIAQWGEETANMIDDYISGLIIACSEGEWIDALKRIVVFVVIIVILKKITELLIVVIPKP